MPKQGNLFGGDWTQEKLDRVEKYLRAYTTALKNKPFDLVYIDAFAGTGYVDLKRDDDPSGLLLPELAEEESVAFVDGSARIALKVTPRFTRFEFIEKSPERFARLELLRSEFPDLADAISTTKADANEHLKEICSTQDWRRQRAVLFLDPYGMQVTWDTLAAIAATQGIDLWLLFPLGIAVNRLLKTDGQIDPKIRKRLDDLFGTTEWYESFYSSEGAEGLFGPTSSVRKTATPYSIGEYFKARLKTVFAGVAENPLELTNSRGTPLYLLCFAASNPNGAPIAIRIAENILRK